MRRTIAGVVVGVLFGGLAPVSAGTPNSTVAPNPVRHGKKLTIEALGCVTPGPFESPFVSTTIVDSEGTEVYSSYEPGDDSDGVNTLKVKIRKAKYPTGTYTVHVDCYIEDEFGVTSGYDYQDVHELKVKKPKKS